MKARVLNIDRLQEELESRNIPTSRYFLGKRLVVNGEVVVKYGDTEDRTVIEQSEEDKWHVYFSERGNRLDERTFTSENEACYNMLNRMVKNAKK